MLINFTDPMFSNRVLGFENLVDRFERLSNESQSGYPPYNIYKDGPILINIIWWVTGLRFVRKSFESINEIFKT